MALAATRDAWQQGLITARDLEQLTGRLPDLAASFGGDPQLMTGRYNSPPTSDTWHDVWSTTGVRLTYRRCAR